MSDVITALTYSLNNDRQRLDVISQNVANVNTQGYKRAQVSQLRFDQVMANQASQNSTSANRSVQQVYDFSQGAIKFTGSSFHVAMKGSALMQVGELDQVSFTRKGEMHLDAQGRLSLISGEPVNAEAGFIYLQPQPFEISVSGEVTQNDEFIGQIQLRELEDSRSWVPVGAGLYQLAEDAVAVSDTNTLLQHKYLEASNVNTLDEMLQMIEVNRHFQTGHQVLKGYDGMLDKAINMIGEF